MGEQGPGGEGGAAPRAARDQGRTAITRLAEYGSRERQVLDQLLDDQFVGHVALVRADGYPVILPTVWDAWSANLANAGTLDWIVRPKELG